MQTAGFDPMMSNGLMGKIAKMVLAELASKTEQNSAASNRAKFLSMRDDIQTLIITESIPVISVWRILVEKKLVSYSYETFNRYCKIYIIEKDAATVVHAPAPSSKILAAKISATDKIQKDNAGTPAGHDEKPAQPLSTRGFVMNSNPDTEGLL